MSWLKERAWPHLRAILVALHVAAVVLMAAPAPGGGMKRSAWKDPTVQAEFSAWVERINGWGAELTHEEFEDGLWQIASRFMSVRNEVLEPFRPYYRYMGVAQSWRMFIAPHRYPARLHLEIRERREWRTVYVARSDEHVWMRQQLDHDRMRSATFRYAWKHYGGTWRQFVDWLAREAAEDFPDAELLRAKMFKYKTLSPEQVRAGEEPDGKFINQRVVDLNKLRETL